MSQEIHCNRRFSGLQLFELSGHISSDTIMIHSGS